MARRCPQHFLILPLASLVLSPCGVFGQDFVTLGSGYQSVESFKLGEYSGLTDKAPFGIGAFRFNRADSWNADTARYWRLSGNNLGLDTRSLEAATGYRGRWGLALSWSELPHYRFDNPVSTPYAGAGTARQQLPAGWVGAASTAGLTMLNTSLQDVAIHTDRQKLAMNLDWHLNSTWAFSGEYKRETKKGNNTLGAIFGSTGGNPRGAILAAPVDYVNDMVSLNLSHETGRSQTSLFYKISLFNNGNRSLQWDNPFNNSAWTAGAGFADAAVGEMALAPDNRFFQTGISSVYRLGESSRISGNVGFGRMRQDESFLPYSNVFASAEPLPVTSLDGRVDTFNALLNYSTRLGQKSSLRLRYTLDDRDNNTQVHLFLRVPGDAEAQGGLLSSNARRNRPYSFRNQRLAADADYRLTGTSKLSFGYELETRKRNRVDVDKTREHSGNIKLSMANVVGGRGWIQYSLARRTASDYTGNEGFLAGHNPDFINTLAGDALFENDPLLRRFHLANRDRRQLAANFNVAPTAMLSVDIIGKLSQDQFPDSFIGVQDSDNRHLTLNLNLDPPSTWHAWTYVTTKRYLNKQQGYSRRGGASPTPVLPAASRPDGNNWWIESTDHVLTTGAGMNWNLLQEKLDITLDINLSDARTETTPASSGQAWAAFSDIDSVRTTFNFKGSYTTASGHQLGLRYSHEKFSSSDFAFDNVATDTLSNVILLGNSAPDYSGYIIELSFLYNLDGR